MLRARPIAISLALLTGATLWGCDRKDPVAVYQAPKDTTPVVTSMVGPANSSVDAPPRPAAGELAWTAPDSWKQEQTGGEMRFATYLINEDPKVELTVVPLGSEAGDLLPNVNRWEKQLHLPPSPAEKLGNVAHPEVINGLDATLIDLTGPARSTPRQRMLAAIVPHADRVWFFKLVGPAEIVSAQKSNFDAFIHSLHPGAANHETPVAEASTNTPSAPDPSRSGMAALPATPSKVKLVKWSADQSWKEIPGSTGPRAVAFDVGTSDKPAQLIVTHFPEGGAGNFIDNVNRWRGQLGLGPVEDPHSLGLKDVSIGKDGAGMALDLNNPANSKRMVVAIGITGSELWFYKLWGQSDTVAAQKPAFEAFLKSVEFGPAQ